MVQSRCVMADILNTQTKFKFKVATAEVHQRKEGALFYILPPLPVLGVFIYCAMVSPEKATPPPATTAPPQKIEYSTTAQPVSDEELNEDGEGDEEEEEEEEDAADE